MTFILSSPSFWSFLAMESVIIVEPRVKLNRPYLKSTTHLRAALKNCKSFFSLQKHLCVTQPNLKRIKGRKRKKISSSRCIAKAVQAKDPQLWRNSKRITFTLTITIWLKKEKNRGLSGLKKLDSKRKRERKLCWIDGTSCQIISKSFWVQLKMWRNGNEKYKTSLWMSSKLRTKTFSWISYLKTCSMNNFKFLGGSNQSTTRSNNPRKKTGKFKETLSTRLTK